MNNGVKRKIRSSTNPTVGPSLEDLPTGDLPTLRNVLAKALWIKENATDSSNNFNTKELGQQMVPIIFQSYKSFATFVPRKVCLQQIR